MWQIVNVWCSEVPLHLVCSAVSPLLFVVRVSLRLLT